MQRRKKYFKYNDFSREFILPSTNIDKSHHYIFDVKSITSILMVLKFRKKRW